MLTDDQKRNVTNWIEALRSGEYEQGQECLIHIETDTSDGTAIGRVTTYCCLGVYGVINNYEDITIVNGVDLDYAFSGVISTKESYLDSERFYDETGLDKYNNQVRLGAWNDDHITFDEIADALEYYLIAGVFPDDMFGLVRAEGGWDD